MTRTRTRVVDVPGRQPVGNGNGNGNGNRANWSGTPRRWRNLRPSRRLSGATKEGFVLWAIAYVVYAAIGLQVTLRQHVVVFDGLARLAHAYFVWHNAPPKLTAIGFVWPPVATIVYLPLAAIKPLGTSMAALPLTSAFFAAATLVLLNRLFDIANMPRRMRWPLVVAFGVNPMIVFYAGNGMSESAYLFFLTAGTYYLVRWYLIRHPRPLLLASLAFALGILSRYELVTWAAVTVAVLLAVLMRQRVTRMELEGSLLAFLAPITYGIGLWLFFNWLILNDALFWLKNQAPGGVTAGGVGATPSVTTGAPAVSLVHVVGTVASLNARLFPLAIVVGVALLALFVVRRRLLSLALATFLGLNAAFTIVLIYASHAQAYSQLRYNMRAMPLALVGVAWLFMSVRGRTAQTVIWAASLLVLLATLPLTWHMMQTYPEQYLEQAFTNAVATGKDQEGKPSRGGYVVGIGPQRAMATYVDAHVSRTDSILTDDAQTFSVMLLSGKPQLFLDRIDRGDDRWLDVRDNPWGHVRYALISESPNDLVRARYPRSVDGAQPGFVQVYRVPGLRLFRISRRPPGFRQLPTQ